MPPKKSQPSPPPRPASGSNDSGMFSLLGTASTMGLHMVSGPIVGGVLGWLVDKWLDSWPIGAAVGLGLGVAAGFRNVWVDARYLIREQEKTPGAGRPDEGAAEAPEKKETPSGSEIRRPDDKPNGDGRP